jgi:hypothetical protein
MMRFMAVYIDDEPVELEGEHLSGVLAAAQAYLRPRGRLIVEVSVDGRPVVGEQLDAQAALSVAGSEVRLASASPEELVCAALEDARAALAEARDLQMEAAELLQQDDAGAAMRKVAAAVTLWQQTQEAVMQSLRVTDVRLEDLRVDGRGSDELIQELIDQLKRVMELKVHNDAIGLADALAYEWPRTLEAWDRMIEQLIDRVRSDARGR